MENSETASKDPSRSSGHILSHAFFLSTLNVFHHLMNKNSLVWFPEEKNRKEAESQISVHSQKIKRKSKESGITTTTKKPVKDVRPTEWPDNLAPCSWGSRWGQRDWGSWGRKKALPKVPYGVPLTGIMNHEVLEQHWHTSVQVRCIINHSLLIRFISSKSSPANEWTDPQNVKCIILYIGGSGQLIFVFCLVLRAALM